MGDLLCCVIVIERKRMEWNGINEFERIGLNGIGVDWIGLNGINEFERNGLNGIE